MILDWFKAGEAVLFAQEVVREINRLFPPTDQKGKAIPKKVFEKKFESLVVRTRAFAQKHKLNVYKKAKFLNTIKWELREAGHQDDLIDDVIALITPLLSR
jgi:hypothetical protein